jgi:hypothetical protein
MQCALTLFIMHGRVPIGRVKGIDYGRGRKNGGFFNTEFYRNFLKILSLKKLNFDFKN